MARYIDADKFIKWIEKQKRLSKGYTIFMLQETATADVEEVKWIDVNERLPDKDGRYLVYRKLGCGNAKTIETTLFEINSSYSQYIWGHEITHWMPLPEPPKERGVDNG